MDEPKSPVVANAWQQLRKFTQARIALGRAGSSLPTQPHLEFQFAHARARDAVHHPLDVEKLQRTLTGRHFKVLALHSEAKNRQIYLQRPDLGRRLAPESRRTLNGRARLQPEGFDVAIAIVDGLSAFAIEVNAVPFVDTLQTKHLFEKFRVAPLVILTQGRVAIGDEVGEVLRAEVVVVLIGERPGLSSPDSMGIYLTYKPHIGRRDAHRNCISNIRREGLDYGLAADKLLYLLTESRRRQLSGVELKDKSEWVQRAVVSKSLPNSPQSP